MTIPSDPSLVAFSSQRRRLPQDWILAQLRSVQALIKIQFWNSAKKVETLVFGADPQERMRSFWQFLPKKVDAAQKYAIGIQSDRKPVNVTVKGYSSNPYSQQIRSNEAEGISFTLTVIATSSTAAQVSFSAVLAAASFVPGSTSSNNSGRMMVVIYHLQFCNIIGQMQVHQQSIVETFSSSFDWTNLRFETPFDQDAECSYNVDIGELPESELADIEDIKDDGKDRIAKLALQNIFWAMILIPTLVLMHQLVLKWLQNRNRFVPTILQYPHLELWIVLFLFSGLVNAGFQSLSSCNQSLITVGSITVCLIVLFCLWTIYFFAKTQPFNAAFSQVEIKPPNKHASKPGSNSLVPNDTGTPESTMDWIPLEPDTLFFKQEIIKPSGITKIVRIPLFKVKALDWEASQKEAGLVWKSWVTESKDSAPQKVKVKIVGYYSDAKNLASFSGFTQQIGVDSDVLETCLRKADKRERNNEIEVNLECLAGNFTRSYRPLFENIDGNKSRAKYALLLDFSRKLFLSLILVVVSSEELESLIIFLGFLVHFSISAYMSPYIDQSENLVNGVTYFLETLSLLGSVLIAFGKAEEEAASYFIIFVNFLITIFLVVRSLWNNRQFLITLITEFRHNWKDLLMDLSIVEVSVNDCIVQKIPIEQDKTVNGQTPPPSAPSSTLAPLQVQVNSTQDDAMNQIESVQDQHIRDQPSIHQIPGVVPDQTPESSENLPSRAQEIQDPATENGMILKQMARL
eukprot:TRINITY_DN5558_c0_g2_i5.p1 TRINITY_DN5558_c0_g2~~TRINITY_DN5558_c0_g2_i5.p1  ORF type:complete len:744 (-),score=122.28 TRINITY_DN5558_c0_g2_i5:579-2810(-)